MRLVSATKMCGKTIKLLYFIELRSDFVYSRKKLLCERLDYERFLTTATKTNINNKFKTTVRTFAFSAKTQDNIKGLSLVKEELTTSGKDKLDNSLSF